MDGPNEIDEAYDARWPLAVMVVVALMGAVLVAAMLVADREPTRGATAGSAPSAVASEGSMTSSPDPAAVLRSWDAARSRAWAAGDVSGLRELYVEDSAAGARDAAMLTMWADRGLRIEGLGTQLLAVEELRRTPSVLVVRVTDRMVGGVAVGSDVRIRLPVDAASIRVITLRRNDQERWRVSSVRLAS